MRWYVEIAPVGKESLLAKYCLEAPHWQPALQQARQLEGEDDKLGGLSVEFLENGCKAIDAQKRTVYTVSQAPDDADVDERGEVAKSSADEASDAPAPDRPSKRKRSSRKKRSRRSRASISAQKTKLQGSEGAAEVVENAKANSAADDAGGVREASVKSKARARTQIGLGVPLTEEEIAKATEKGRKAEKGRSAAKASDETSNAASKKGAEDGSSKDVDAGKLEAVEPPPLPYEQVHHRVLRSSPKQPFGYGEASLAVELPVTLSDLAKLAEHCVAQERRALEDEATTVVRIAIYDHSFGRQPERPPIVTATHHDWHDELAVAFFPYAMKTADSAATAESVIGGRTLTSSNLPAPRPPREDDERRKVEEKEAARKAEEKRRADEEKKRKAEEKKRQAEEDKRQADEEKRKAEEAERKAAEQAAREAEEAKRKAEDEAARKAEETRKANEAKRTAEEEAARKAEEAKREADEEKRQAEEAKREADEEKRQAEEAKREADEEKRQAEEAKREADVKVASRKAAREVEAKSTAAKEAGRKAAGKRADDLEKSAAAASPKRSADGSADEKHDQQREEEAPSTKEEAPEPKKAKRGRSRRSIAARKRQSEAPEAKRSRPSKSSARKSPSKATVEARGAKRPSSASPSRRPAVAFSEGGLSRRERDQRLEAARDRASIIPPPPSRRGDRVKGEDLLTDVFEAVSELFFLQDALDGADFVLRLALEKLPCEAGFISLYDIDHRHFVIVRQTGGSSSALLHKLDERHPLARRAMRSPGAVVIGKTSKEPEMVDPRWEAASIDPKSLLIVPIQKSGRYLGLLELANPYDGKAFRESDANALSYMGEQFADFLDERGLLLDPDAVIASAEAKG